MPLFGIDAGQHLPAAAPASASTCVFMARKRIEHELLDDGGDPLVYFPSLSARTLVYKGMLTTPQLAPFFPDLTDPRVESAIALVHSRFSTNTFPVVAAGHPVPVQRPQQRGSTAFSRERLQDTDAGPREAMLASPHIDGGAGSAKISPVCTPGASDTARFGEASSCSTSASARCPTRC
ncbi:MAG: hypothetical protein U0Q22_07890 [Acidimicrobiales bacterium]